MCLRGREQSRLPFRRDDNINTCLPFAPVPARRQSRMARQLSVLAECRILVATLIVAMGLSAGGCLAPATISNVESETTESTRPRGSQLTPITIVPGDAIDGTDDLKPDNRTAEPRLPARIAAVPLPASPSAHDRTYALPPGEHGLRVGMGVEEVPPRPVSHGGLPSETSSFDLPPVAASGPPTAPVKQEPLPAPSLPLASPYLGPPVEPFTPSALAAPAVNSFSRSQSEIVASPPVAPAQPPVELLPVFPMPVPRDASPGALQFPARVQLAPPMEPSNQSGGQLSTVQRIKSIQQISLNIAPPPLSDDTGAPLPLPYDNAVEALPLLAAQQPFTRGQWMDYGYDWQPEPIGLEFCYQPLYFEEPNLERYGRSWGILQPAVSAAKFYSRIWVLPYTIFSQPARRCTYHAHWSLPGYRIPTREPYPLYPSVTGATAETAAVIGLFLLIP